MARNPGRNDQIRTALRQREEIRMQRLRPKAHTVDRTFLVGGDITVGMYIPPMFVGINSDESAPEWKYLAALQGNLRTGTATIEWLRNGSLIETQNITTLSSDGYIDLGTTVELAHKDEIQPTVTAASGAADMGVSVVVVSQAS